MIADTAPRPARRIGRHAGFRLSVAFVLALGVAACKSSEEQADEYYQSALQLIQEGDTGRAAVQLRNVFDKDGTHYDARKTLAELHRQEGRIRDAYSQYLRLAEQYPDDLPTRIALTRLAVETAQKDEFERHATRARELAPDDSDVQAIALSQDYLNLPENASMEDRTALLDQAARLAESRPDDVLLLTMLLDRAARMGDLDQAGELIDRLIALQPDNPQRYEQRLAWLVEQGDDAGIEAHLRATVEQFPDSLDAKGDLLAFYVTQNRSEDAEAYLRELAATAPEGDNAARIDLIRYVEMNRGTDAARAEMQAALDQGGDPLVFGTLLAGTDYAAGRQDEAITAIQGLLEGREPSAEVRNVQVQLARMLIDTGRTEEARPLVAQVLAEEPGHVGALKLQAGWDIEADRIDDAILALRAALDSDADDVEALNLIANAYYRAGEPDLMRDFLARAAKASGNAPAETLRFAQSLLSEGRARPAEDALLPALRAEPQNVALLALLGQTYLAMPDLPRAGGVLQRLRELDTPEAMRAAQELELAQLGREQGQDAALSRLQELAADSDGDLDAQMTLLRARLEANDLDGAQSQLDGLLADDPQNRMLRQAEAVLASAGGRNDEARAILDTLIKEDPSEIAPHLMRLRLASQTEPRDDSVALALVDDSLAQLPDNPDLLWAKAGLLERTGDIDGAIAIFETLYAQSSDAVVVANNLASLIATHYANDPERLARATVVARRLAGTTVPPFMDTYGWLLHLNGDSQRALPYLEGAAEALTEDAAVQLHLGIVQAALSQEQAQSQLEQGLDLAGDLEGSTVETARNTLERLRNPAATAPDEATQTN